MTLRGPLSSSVFYGCLKMINFTLNMCFLMKCHRKMQIWTVLETVDKSFLMVDSCYGGLKKLMVMNIDKGKA